MSRTPSDVRRSTLTWPNHIKNVFPAVIILGGLLDKNGRYYVAISHPALDFTERKKVILQGAIFQLPSWQTEKKARTS